MMSGVFSCHTPPNHCEYPTRATPGTASSFGSMLIGSGEVKDTRAWTMRRVAPTKSAPALKMVFTDCSSPNSRNAVITDSSVRIVRVLLRNRLAMTKPLLVMASPWCAVASGRARLLEQLPFFQVQDAPGELRRLRVVRDDHDGLAVLAIEHLQETQDLVGGLAIEVAGGLIAHQQLRVGHQRARDRHALLLSAGQLPRLVLGAVGEADHLEGDRDVLPALRGRQLRQQQRQLDVALGGEHRHEVVELEHEADVVRAPAGELAAAELIDAAAADAD